MPGHHLHRLPVAIAVAALAVLVGGSRVSGHKPITSPFTFYDDVLPITRAKCASCHAPDGIAPMSLLTHEDAVPWGESMKLELIAGHMPPWSSATPRDAFRHTPHLTGRELNVLLTWAAGGTPPGEAKPPSTAEAARSWPLGPPDATLALPEATLDAATPSATREFVLPLDATGRHLAAVDLRPGTPSIVRSARVSVRRAGAGPSAERVVALWVPGDEPFRLPDGSGWTVEAGSEAVVRISYKKRWDREREPATDRSQVGLYFAAAGGTDVAAATLVVGSASERASTDTATVLRARHVPAQGMAIASVWPDTALAGARVRLERVSAGGAQSLVAAFEPRAGWERRYWFTRPLALERGESFQLTATWPRGAQAPAQGAMLLGLDLVPIQR